MKHVDVLADWDIFLFFFFFSFFWIMVRLCLLWFSTLSTLPSIQNRWLLTVSFTAWDMKMRLIYISKLCLCMALAFYLEAQCSHEYMILGGKINCNKRSIHCLCNLEALWYLLTLTYLYAIEFLVKQVSRIEY